MIQVFDHPFDAVIFDMDGTLIDSESLGFRAWTRVLADYGLSLEKEFFAKMVGRTAADVELLFKSTFGDEFPFVDARAKRIEIGDEIIADEGVKLMEGSLEIIDNLISLSVPIALATSTYRERAEYRLSRTPLYGKFKTTVCGDEITSGKPQPDIFLKAANQLGIESDKCLVVEDAKAGVFAAINAGMKCILVPDFVEPDDEVKSVAWRITGSLKEINGAIKKGE